MIQIIRARKVQTLTVATSRLKLTWAQYDNCDWEVRFLDFADNNVAKNNLSHHFPIPWECNLAKACSEAVNNLASIPRMKIIWYDMVWIFRIYRRREIISDLLYHNEIS